MPEVIVSVGKRIFVHVGIRVFVAEQVFTRQLFVAVQPALLVGHPLVGGCEYLAVLRGVKHHHKRILAPPVVVWRAAACCLCRLLEYVVEVGGGADQHVSVMAALLYRAPHHRALLAAAATHVGEMVAEVNSHEIKRLTLACRRDSAQVRLYVRIIVRGPYMPAPHDGSLLVAHAEQRVALVYEIRLHVYRQILVGQVHELHGVDGVRCHKCRILDVGGVAQPRSHVGDRLIIVGLE